MSPGVPGCAAGHDYRRETGIWRLLPPERAAYFRRFMEEYETVRSDEGRHLDDWADAPGIEWEVHRPWYGWRWVPRPWRAPFMVLAARKGAGGRDER